MTSKIFDIVIISPHLDDALLSLGEHMLSWRKKGKSILVVNCFTTFGKTHFEKLPEFTQTYLLNSGYQSVNQFEKKRKLEDILALEEIGVHSINLDFEDGGFRKDKEQFIYPTSADLFSGKISHIDYPLFQNLKKKLAHSISLRTEVFIPFGIGKHVDHLIARQASQFPSTTNKFFYADIPYALDRHNWTLNQVLFLFKQIKSAILSSEKKMHILMHYSSQLPILFPKKPFLIPEIVMYAK